MNGQTPQKASLARGAGAIQTEGHLDIHHKNLCEFRDRLRDFNNSMRDTSMKLTGNNPIPAEASSDIPTAEGLFSAITTTMGEIELQLQDYSKIVQHFNTL